VNVRWLMSPNPQTTEQLNAVMNVALELGEQWVAFTLYSRKLRATVLCLISFN